MKKFIKKAITLLTVLCLSLTSLVGLVACGKLELKSFELVPQSVTTKYALNDAVDFSGIQVRITYSDEAHNKTLTYNDLILDYDANLTATEGEKTVTFKYIDTVLDNAERKGDFKVTVYKNAVDMEEVYVSDFSIPTSLALRANKIANAGTAEYGSEQFAGQFYGGGDATYYVGDDNAFKFLPRMTALVYDDNGAASTSIVSLYRSVATISMYNDQTTNYDVLSAREVENTNYVEYYAGDDKIVTFDSLNNEYSFNQDSNVCVGKKFKISVVPASNYVSDDEINPVVIEIKVIDAFNVYNAKQLSAIDNYNGYHNWDDEDKLNVWNDIKLSAGVPTDRAVNGVVLHNDLTLTTSDIPQEFLIEAEATATYTDDDPNTPDVTINAGDKVLRDNTDFYIREQGGEFVIQGNYFNIDTSKMPKAGSHALFPTQTGNHYGDDFSNVTLFKFRGTLAEGSIQGQDLNATISNLSLVGNASRNELKDSMDKPLSAGGLIFLKSQLGVTTVNNVTGNSYFISYFPDSDEDELNRNGKVVLNSVKCYDSYQNAAFLWGNTTIEINNSTLENSGGPLIIMQHPTDNGRGFGSRATFIPTMTATNSNLKSELNGGEFWFSAVNAGPLVSQVTVLDSLFTLLSVNKAMFTNVNGAQKMNIVAVTMTATSNPAEAVEDGTSQARVAITKNSKTFVHSRLATDANWLASVQKLGNYRVVCFDNDSTTANKIFIDNANNAFDVNGNAFNPQGSLEHAAIYQAITASDYFSVNMGGISIVFQLYAKA